MIKKLEGGMKWTKDKPQVDGWYWVTKNNFYNMGVLFIRTDPDGRVAIYFPTEDCSYIISVVDTSLYEFAGPIEIPDTWETNLCNK